MTAARLGWWLALGLCVGACGDDGDGGGGGGPEAQACNDVCQAQEAAETAGNCPGVGLSLCRSLCNATLAGDCDAEFTALNECQLTGDFDCGFVSAESDADCDAEIEAYQKCGACEGADADGTCPVVACGCPGGEQMISGSMASGGSCRCVDSTTCKDLCF